MPRTRPLTKAQKDRQEVERVGGDILKIIRVSAPVIKCKKTPVKKCSFMAERGEIR